jgi:hypothetical protein
MQRRRRADGTPSTTTTTDTQTLTQNVATIAVSAGVLFLTIWVISKAWKTGQKTA